MAWDPCVSCGKSFHGSTVFSYVTWHTGEQRNAYRLRQCLECAVEFRNGILATADYRDKADQWRRAADYLEAPADPVVSPNGAPRGM